MEGAKLGTDNSILDGMQKHIPMRFKLKIKMKINLYLEVNEAFEKSNPSGQAGSCSTGESQEEKPLPGVPTTHGLGLGKEVITLVFAKHLEAEPFPISCCLSQRTGASS